MTMIFFDFIYYIGYHSGKRNGFSDAPSLYGKIIFSAIIYSLHLSFNNVLKLIGYNFFFGFANLNVMLIAFGVIFVLVFLIYNKREKVCNKFNVSGKRVRIYFNVFL